MTTVLVGIIVCQMVLEIATAVVFYKKRFVVREALRDYLGIHDMDCRLDDLNTTANLTHKVAKRIRRAQKKTVAKKQEPADEVMCKVHELAKSGELIEAIKYLRSHKTARYGGTISLMDAKNVVEAILDGRSYSLDFS